MGAQEHYPRIQEVAIGVNPSAVADTDTGYIAGWKVGDVKTPLMCLVENKGEAAFTVSMKESNDNGASDAFTALTLRRNAANVTSIVVNPGGAVRFTIETIAKAFIKLNVPASDKPFGRAVITHFYGAFERRERSGL